MWGDELNEFIDVNNIFIKFLKGDIKYIPWCDYIANETNIINVPLINLNQKGYLTTVADARFAKPLDEKLIIDLCLNHEVVLTVEEGSIGGFGSHVFQLISERGILDKGLKIRSMILPDVFLDHDTGTIV